MTLLALSNDQPVVLVPSVIAQGAPALAPRGVVGEADGGVVREGDAGQPAGMVQRVVCGSAPAVGVAGCRPVCVVRPAFTRRAGVGDAGFLVERSVSPKQNRLQAV